jgi:hypothetical protein
MRYRNLWHRLHRTQRWLPGRVLSWLVGKDLDAQCWAAGGKVYREKNGKLVEKSRWSI